MVYSEVFVMVVLLVALMVGYLAAGKVLKMVAASALAEASWWVALMEIWKVVLTDNFSVSLTVSQ
jgi:hypothetical protein